MLHLISAPKDGGKTSCVKQLFMEQKRGRGFCSEKIMKDGVLFGYVLRDLHGGGTKNIALRDGEAGLFRGEESFCHGPYRFFNEAFVWAQGLYAQACEEGASAFFIDELGQIEIHGGGHAALIRQAAASSRNMDLYITVRDSFVHEACRAFCFKDYHLLSLF